MSDIRANFPCPTARTKTETGGASVDVSFKALLHLYEGKDLAMSTNFVAFWKELERQGVSADYYSIFDLTDIIKDKGPSIYDRDDIPGRESEVILEAGRDKFYTIIKDSFKL